MKGVDVPTGFSASLSVRPRRNQRIGPPHGDCIDHDPFLTPSNVSRVYRQVACQQKCLQKHIRKRCQCDDESLPPVDDEEGILPLCRKLNFSSQCAWSPDDVGVCVDELIKWYERLKCAKRMREHVQVCRTGSDARCFLYSVRFVADSL